MIDYFDSALKNFYSHNLANKMSCLGWKQEGEFLELEGGQPVLIVLEWREVKKVDYASCQKDSVLQNVDMLF